MNLMIVYNLQDQIQRLDPRAWITRKHHRIKSVSYTSHGFCFSIIKVMEESKFQEKIVFSNHNRGYERKMFIE